MYFISAVVAVALTLTLAPAAGAAEGAPSGSVAVGSLHSCALRTNATIACWGRTFEGQTSPPAGTFTAIEAGGQGSSGCGLRTDGTVACWGALDAQPPVGTFTSLGGSSPHACAVRTGGSLACWGRNLQGESSPPAGTFTSVSAGWLHSCGLRTDGTLACWGTNNFGQSAPPAGTFTAVAAGEWHSCGLRGDGTIACWGDNDDAEATPPAGTFTEIAAGVAHNCALRSDQTVACWGRDGNGQASPPAGRFTALDAARGHTCGLRIDGALICWGQNAFGEGISPGAGFGARAVDAGTDNTCGVDADGTLACWGAVAAPPAATFTAVSAGNGACGVGENGTLSCWDGAGTPPAGAFRSVSAGTSAGCGVRADGRAGCWGTATPPPFEYAAISAGGTTACGLQTNGELSCWGGIPEPLGTYTDVSVGGDHACAIATAGTLSCFGDAFAAPPTGTFTALSVGSAHACAVATDGTLSCWGANGSGQSTPPSGAFKDVSVGDAHSCALRADNTATCWGSSAGGRLGAPPAAPGPQPPSGVFARLLYSHDFASAGAPAARFAVTAGNLPPGLTLAADGRLSGMPTAGGTFTFIVSASNGFFPPDASAPFSITVVNDTTAPQITPTVNGTLGENGWYTGDVAVSWAVAEAESSSTLETTGCGAATVTTDTAATTFTCEAESVGGTASQSVTIKRDTTAPDVDCAQPDDAWHAEDVRLGCTAADGGSGLANAGDAAFELATDVPAGTETATAETDSRVVADLAGNTTSADALGPIKVDKLAPTIAIDAPVAGSYEFGQAVAAGYRCEDDGSGIGECAGPVASGANVDTATSGEKTFEVVATDDAGNTSRQSVRYTVNAPAAAPPAAPPASPGSSVSPGATLRVRTPRLALFGRPTARCVVAGGEQGSCVVRMLAGGRVVAAGHAAGTRVRLRLTRHGKALLGRTLGGVRVRVEARSGDLVAPGRARAILRVERFTTPPAAWRPGDTGLTRRGLRFVRGLRGSLVAVAGIRCDGYAANAEGSLTAVGLSRERATTMCAALGVDAPARIVGRGDIRPIASNRTEAGRAANRRVEVTVTHG